MSSAFKVGHLFSPTINWQPCVCRPSASTGICCHWSQTIGICCSRHSRHLYHYKYQIWYTGKSQIYSILGYPRNSCKKFKIFCKFQKIRNLQEILTVPCIFWEYIKYSWVLRSRDSHNARSCDLSAPEYLKYSRKMHGTVKISYRFLIFWNLQNIINFPQLFLGYLRIEYNWLFPVGISSCSFL